jgi:NADH-quinone oxidoreductase subunit M
MPLTALAFLIGALNISGIPPTVGFTSKFMIFLGVFSPATNVTAIDFALAVVAILSTILTIGYTLWAMRRIFYGPLPENLSKVSEASPLMTIPMIALCVLSIILGIYPKPIMDPLIQVITALLK